MGSSAANSKSSAATTALSDSDNGGGPFALPFGLRLKSTSAVNNGNSQRKVRKNLFCHKMQILLIKVLMISRYQIVVYR